MPITIEDKIIQLQSGIRVKVDKIEILGVGFIGHGFFQIYTLLGYKKGKPIDILYNEEGKFKKFREY